MFEFKNVYFWVTVRKFYFCDITVFPFFFVLLVLRIEALVLIVLLFDLSSSLNIMYANNTHGISASLLRTREVIWHVYQQEEGGWTCSCAAFKLKDHHDIKWFLNFKPILGPLKSYWFEKPMRKNLVITFNFNFDFR